jgi:hypothetical protein
VGRVSGAFITLHSPLSFIRCELWGSALSSRLNFRNRDKPTSEVGDEAKRFHGCILVQQPRDIDLKYKRTAISFT